MILPIIKPPDPILSTEAAPVLPGQDISALIRNMIDTLRASPGGVGLAAPQVGHSLRVIVVDPTGGRELHAARVMINPEIVATWGGGITEAEMCLSLPLVRATVERASFCTVRYTDTEHQLVERDCSVWESRIIQHEIDHLDGRTMLAYMKPMARARALETIRLGRKV